VTGQDITPEIAAGRQLIHSYGDGRFRVAGQVYEGSILVFPERTIPWSVTGTDGMTEDTFAEVTGVVPPPEILLIGCGAVFSPPPGDLGVAFRQRGISMDWMDTGAACRTFNVLIGEDRSVAAALIAVD